jgi:hypothetical protein
VLETTLAMTFAPGTNVKGEVPGANWIFLLPRLAFVRVVILGTPTPADLRALAAHAQEIVVLAGETEQLANFASRGSTQKLPNVHLLPYQPGEELPLKASSADLIVLLDSAARRLERDEAWQVAIARVLAPSGLLYHEQLRFPWSATDQYERPAVAGLFPGKKCFQLQPPLGAVRFAAPAGTGALLDEVMTRVPYHSTLLPRLIKPLQRRRKAQTPSADQPAGETPTGRSRSRAWRARLRWAGKRTLPRVEAIEGAAVRRQRLLHRYGMLWSRVEVGDPPSPPTYLCQLASKHRLDISNFNWVLAAPADYASRKILFFLDHPEQAGDTRIIVKMVRQPALNSRLENEHRALSSLARQKIGRPGTLPRPLFQGHHHGLAISGQTRIEGVPFAARTTYRPDCPSARAAVEWLTELGSATAAPTRAGATSASLVLQHLWTQFAAIYEPSAELRHFLEEQLQLLSQSQQPFPAVFQHGDPGTWNVLVNPAGDIVFLDWEAAEEQGMPLWDLFYFLRSYVAGSGGRWAFRAISPVSASSF